MSAFVNVVAAAVNMAEATTPADGYVLLLEGLHHVKQRGGKEAWLDEAIARYQTVLDRYAALHGIGRA